MDELELLRENFDPDAAPAPDAQARARTALRNRIGGSAPSRRRMSWGLRIPVAVGLATAAAVVTGVTITHLGGVAQPTPPPPVALPASRPAPSSPAKAVGPVPYFRPANATQYLENAAWTAEQRPWVTPRPDQFMYVEALELRNESKYEQNNPNGAIVPKLAQYRKTQVWNEIDGMAQGYLVKGKLEVRRQGAGTYWSSLPWSVYGSLTTAAKVAAYAEHPEKYQIWVEPTALLGQYVLPPNVQAAIFRYLSTLPGMKVSPDAVNIDGRPAIGMGQILEGYLSQELLFDKQTYALIGERLIAVKKHTAKSLDATRNIRKGDLFRQVIYLKMTIVDEAGETS